MKSSKNLPKSLTPEQIRARSGEILRKNLIENNEFPKPDYAAHHIIPLADRRTKYAILVRDLFDQFFPPKEYENLDLKEWPINQHFNGVWLRNANYHLLKEKEIPHSIIHTNDYYKEIYQRLKSATTREEFLEQLRLVKEDIIHNRFWDRNPQKLKEIEDYRQEKINEYQILKEYEEELKDIPYHLLDPDTEEKAHSIARTSDHTTEDYRTVIDRIREEIKNEGSIWSETIKGSTSTKEIGIKKTKLIIKSRIESQTSQLRKITPSPKSINQSSYS